MVHHLSYDVLSRLVERRAAPVVDARAQRHLTSCGRCRSELAWLERIRTLPQRGVSLVYRSDIVDDAGDGWGNRGQARSAQLGSARL
jgi:hypothetical protein